MKAKINNLQNYKRAKIISKDLEKIIPILAKTYEQLKPYMKYRPILDTLDTISDSKLVLEIHLSQEKRIVDSMGEE